ncbi:MAG: tRNA preQ1(34) S-adenosylmethionine ribosyltransferase-isomerase QueA [Candidatus Cloacimonetes bacterium]|nr:tRNA preQ1(34) S-adenosylmethionine ribosyltransferase-isomerase QueA [Candidatus Cloacimonadota bacterium]
MNKDLSKKSSYYYDLPANLIAQHPLEVRSESRLLVLEKSSGKVEHHIFHEIEQYLAKGDVLVVNNTRVIPARLHGKKDSGANVEILLLNQKNAQDWECLVRPGKKLKPGSRVTITESLEAEVLSYGEDGSRIVKFKFEGDFFALLQKVGKIPLPPYINRPATEKDKQTYQTVYAQSPGSVAAPTAGLHFTRDLLDKLTGKGVIITEVDLNVGLGTFRPVKNDNISDHVMHREFCSISSETAAIINQAKAENRRVISVGTTSTRTMESFAEQGKVKSGSHFTDIFIYPGSREIQIIDGLLTNFHLPESTLLMLVSAFAGYQNTMQAYQEAIKNNYRFFSYGDAMLIL